MGKINIGPSTKSTILESKVDAVALPQREILYIERPIIEEKIVVQEKIVEKPVFQEKIIYVDKPVIQEKHTVEYIDRDYDEQIEILSHDLQEIEDLCHNELHSLNMQLDAHESRLHEISKGLLDRLRSDDLNVIKILLGVSLLLNVINLLWR